MFRETLFFVSAIALRKMFSSEILSVSYTVSL